MTPSPPKSLSKRHLLFVAGIAGIAAWAVFSPHSFRTVGIFVSMLSLLVFVHEWGHFQFARWSGMRVNRFAVGFPPWLLTRQKNGIVYSVGALPIGGMVDIAGLGSEREMVSHLKGEEGEARAAKDSSSGTGLFQHATLGRRFWTLFAGPLMNFIYAMVIFVVMYSMVGMPEPFNTNRIDEIPPNSHATAAGIRVGDRIVGFNAGGKEFRSTDVGELKTFVRRSEKPVITAIIQRDGAELRRPLERLVQEADPSDPIKDKNGKTLPASGLGVRFHIETDYKRLSVVGALQQGAAEVVGMWQGLSALLFRAATVRLTAADRSSVGGPVRIAEMVGQYTLLGWPAIIILSGVLSVNLALMNLLPMPALDGGRILFLGYEAIAGKPVDPKVENRAHAIGMLCLLAFMAFISLRDVFTIVARYF